MISCINERNFLYAEIRDIQSFYQEAIAWAFMNDDDYVISRNMNDYAPDLDLIITSSNIPELGEKWFLDWTLVFQGLCIMTRCTWIP